MDLPELSNQFHIRVYICKEIQYTDKDCLERTKSKRLSPMISHSPSQVRYNLLHQHFSCSNRICASRWVRSQIENLYRALFYQLRKCIMKTGKILLTCNKPAVLRQWQIFLRWVQMTSKGIQHQLSGLAELGPRFYHTFHRFMLLSPVPDSTLTY